MTAGRVRGWCPSLCEPMAAGDGLLVRVKPSQSRLRVAAMRGLAEAARRFGNGVIELTSRANLQVRGLTPLSVAGFAEAMRALGLAAATPEAERARNVAVSPLHGDDPATAPGTGAVASALVAGVTQDPGLHALPPKFGFAVDGGGALPLATAWASITLRASGDAWLIIPQGSAVAAEVEAADAVPAALALARAFLGRGGRRMGALVAQDGAQALLARCGLAGSRPVAPAVEIARPGSLAYRGAERCAVLAAPRFGQLMAADLTVLTGLAQRLGCESVGVAPSRLLTLGRVRTGDLARALAEIADLGLIVDPSDPACAIAACQGAPRCASARTPARADAQRLARMARMRGAMPRLHVSGCSKGCAHPGSAPVTLVGAEDGYALVVNGRASDPPALRGLAPEAALDAALNASGRLHAGESAPCP